MLMWLPHGGGDLLDLFDRRLLDDGGSDLALLTRAHLGVEVEQSGNGLLRRPVVEDPPLCSLGESVTEFPIFDQDAELLDELLGRAVEQAGLAVHDLSIGGSLSSERGLGLLP